MSDSPVTPTPAAKPWYKKKKWIAVIVLAVLIAIASAGGGSQKDKKATDTTAASTTAVTTAGSTTTTVAAAGKTWVAVSSLSGSADKTGDTFHLDKAQTRLRYSMDVSFGAIYVMQDGKNLESDGGIPEVTCTKKCADETNLRRDAGDYYLAVKGSGNWTVTVEQYK